MKPANKGWINHQGLKRERIGSTAATVRNGDKTVVINFEILEQATDEVIIGLNDFKKLGYSLSGVQRRVHQSLRLMKSHQRILMV